MSAAKASEFGYAQPDPPARKPKSIFVPDHEDKRRKEKHSRPGARLLTLRLEVNGEFVADMVHMKQFAVYENLDLVVTSNNLLSIDEKGVIGFANIQGGLKGALTKGSSVCDALTLSNGDLRALINLGAFDDEQEAFIFKKKGWRAE